ncbi:uncharacterized protein LOC122244716 isoform X2 [Penaeus japonicus]|uniref:uncharacterized protein LOC122244716 isoform X2 n=1 Tax=Penaeus japonicus TaxID=27405 RepID=UPI001C7149D1|nr:uncharacterized protein LOC122244716 isoform X2 [Penaeus japonicus]
MAFQSGSPYLPRVNRAIQTMKESGILPKWIDEQTSNTSQCLLPPSSDITDGIEPLNIEDLAGPFLTLAAGLIFSSLIFIFEHAASWSKNENETLL